MVDNTTDIDIEIDGQRLKAKPNQTVIQVADAAGIYIPRFCYHKHLSIAANCRMCLVDVEKAPKALPACATPVMPGMKVFTKSAKTIEAQKAVMEFLLINHPLDCPVCDQGGECELQDLSMGYGASHSNYHECKRSVADEDLGPLIATEMTRCILCTRCVRFGAEVAGLRELGVTHRGEVSEISTYVAHMIESPVSGNVIDLCPVGALTSKPYRFTARAWELQQGFSISPHDGMGSHLNVHTINGNVKRVVPRECDVLNETWLSDRDRYSYTGLTHEARLTTPKIKQDGEWVSITWEKALSAAVESIQKVLNTHTPDQLGALIAPQATLEEAYLAQKLLRGLGSPHVDHRLREVDTRDQSAMPLYPGFTATLPEIENAEAIFIVGAHVTHDLPLLSLRLRKAALKGTHIAVLNAVDYDFNFKVAAKAIVAPHHWVKVLTELAAGKASELLSTLKDKTKVAILLGSGVQHHVEAANLRYLAKQLAKQWNGQCHLITDGPNAAGCWIAGAIPHRLPGGVTANKMGLSASAMLAKPRKGYLLHQASLLDMANASNAAQAFSQADCVIALTAFNDPYLERYATLLLPVAPFTETSGTYVNAFGQWQAFKGLAKPLGEARPAWKVWRVLANLLHVEGFDQESSHDVFNELSRHTDKVTIETELADLSLSAFQGQYSRIGDIPLYAGDALVRHATPLQTAQSYIVNDVNAIHLHPETAQSLGVSVGQRLTVKQSGNSVALSVVIDKRIAKEALWIAGATEASVNLGDLMGAIEVQGVC